jgi:hypothetical protein
MWQRPTCLFSARTRKRTALVSSPVLSRESSLTLAALCVCAAWLVRVRVRVRVRVVMC